MTPASLFSRRALRSGLALAAGAAIVAGATWHGASISAQSSTAKAAAAPVITHAIAGGRDSYADIVRVVTPAVVTAAPAAVGRAMPLLAELLPKGLAGVCHQELSVLR